MNAPRDWPPEVAAAAGAASPTPAPKATRESVVAVRHWSEALVSLRVTRDPSFRFVAGRYARLGLAGPEGIVVTRPLSIASAASQPHLDFLCTLVPGGELSALVARSAQGDAAFVERASFGFLTVDTLAPGRDLWLVATGTGIAPFLSILHEPAVRSSFERSVVVHSVRVAAELAPAAHLAREAVSRGQAQLAYVPIVTREPAATALSSRIPALLDDGRLEEAAGVPIDVARTRVMACGNPAMAQELRARLAARGFQPSRRRAPGQMAFENYWKDRP